MISQRAKYALRAMIMLAQHSNGERVLTATIAAEQNVPKKFLEAILLDLKRHGFLDSYRGRDGGYVLARPAHEITFGDILRSTDGPLAPVPCVSLSRYRPCADCADEATCPIRRVMADVRDAIAGILDHTTLADAAGGLARLLVDESSV